MTERDGVGRHDCDQRRGAGSHDGEWRRWVSRGNAGRWGGIMEHDGGRYRRDDDERR